MKFHTAVSLLLASITAGIHAFSSSSLHRHRAIPSVLFMQDSAEAVKAAMEASETHGKTSPEARAAWSLVEEIDAANR